jgi:hypothetical protein
MLTIFAIPKPFRGHFDIIQQNAIESWVHLDIHPEVILFGDEEGSAEIAQKFGVTHIPDVKKNEFGTPLISDIFSQAQQHSRNLLVCYINADIMLLNDFGRAVSYVSNLKHPFLMSGQRWDTSITTRLDYNQNYEKKIRDYALEHGIQHPPTGIDYFVFPRQFLPSMPPFAVGRPSWDNWTLYQVRSRKAMLIDATQAVFAIHQNHDYSHHPQGETGVWQGKESHQNFELAGGWDYIFTLEDATHMLTPNGIKPALSYKHLRRQMNVLGILRPRFRLLSRILNRCFRLLDRVFVKKLV